MPPIPVAAFLVPPVVPFAPDGFARLETTLPSGLPATIQLDKELSLVLSLPTGLVRTWRDAATAELVTTSDDQLAIAGPADPTAPMRAPIRVQVRQGARTLGVAPLVVGKRVRAGLVAQDSGGDPALATGAASASTGVVAAAPAGAPGSEAAPAAAIEYVVLEWTIRAGSLRGSADAGSRLVLAWRRADRAVEHYSEPPVNPYFAPRLPPAKRIESTIHDKRFVKLLRLDASDARSRLLTRAIVRIR